MTAPGAQGRRPARWRLAAIALLALGVTATLFALTIPIAVHCLIAYGVQLTSPRVAIHSIAGCFSYGAFAAKVLIVRCYNRKRAGAAIFTLLYQLGKSTVLYKYMAGR